MTELQGNHVTQKACLPLRYQVMLGAGAPSAAQGMVASLPSVAVMFDGAFVSTGAEAKRQKQH